MSREARIAFWIAALVATGILIELLSDVLLPFVAGMAIAYFFDPLADRLEARRVPRGAAAAIILLGFMVLALAGLAVLLPLLQGQIVALAGIVPEVIDRSRQVLEPYLRDLMATLPAETLSDAKGAAANYAGTVIGWLTKMLASVWQGGMAFFNLLSLLVITPLVAFYMLRDWDLLVARFDSYLPRAAAPTIREQVRAIDTTIAGFVRGQGLVCLSLAVWYGVALTVLGLNSGLIVGLAAGAISFIPYIGAMVGMVVGVGIAIFQFPEWQPVLIIAAVFLVGQTAESYFLTPRLVGGRVGLSPVAIIFALLAGGALFGFVGVLLAVPVSSVIGVLVRFALARYRDSELYSGGSGDGDRESP